MNGKKKLNVFDFDGTLVATLESEAGKEQYFKLTGKQWMIENTAAAIANDFNPKFRRIGWWGRPETLQPPLLPRPLPDDYLIKHTFEGYQKAKADPDAFNVLVTGRHMKIGPLVEDILKELKLEFDEYYYKGHPSISRMKDFPTDNDTPKYKLFAIKDFLMKRAEYTHLEIWEDRLDVVTLFRDTMVPQLKDEHPQLECVSIHDVKEMRDYHYPLTACKLRATWKLRSDNPSIPFGDLENYTTENSGNLETK